MIFSLFRDYKPLTFFGVIGLILMILGLIPGAVVVYEFVETGVVAFAFCGTFRGPGAGRDAVVHDRTGSSHHNPSIKGDGST